MITDLFAEQIAQEFRYSFTEDQRVAVESLARFILSPQSRSVFILTGYAGTGKTTLVSALVRVMKKLERDIVLLAPTGRAAKVFSAYAHTSAHTVHRTIYRQHAFEGEQTRFSLGFNKRKMTLFVVDEASMLANEQNPDTLFGTGRLLDDLLQYVYSGSGCKLLLMGDLAQLPPVGEPESPALCATTYEQMGFQVFSANLSQVVRQDADSDVLENATYLRTLLSSPTTSLPGVRIRPDGDVCSIRGGEFVEELENCYSEAGEDQTIVVTLSNKRAMQYNIGIRQRIFDREDTLARGDRIMVVKNNYYWTEKLRKALPDSEQPPFDFIANGDSAEVVSVSNVHVEHGFRFADVELRFTDYDDYEIGCRVLLDTLTSESPALTAEQSERLYQQVYADYSFLHSKKKINEQVRQDPYYNALQIKFAYTVTCHKAQGGQWERVFIDQGYLPPNMDQSAYIRWLYTAFTRTTDRLYLVNWPNNQTEKSD
ncbi:MAG: AAA family ATPase [Alloprevotella sp.]|nr:AAA family ATPase [Alloprevotella sp.]